MINNKNSYNIAQTHTNADISGVFWIKKTEKYGETKKSLKEEDKQN